MKICSLCKNEIKSFKVYNFKNNLYCKECASLVKQIEGKFSFDNDPKGYCPRCKIECAIDYPDAKELIIECPDTKVTLKGVTGVKIRSKEKEICSKCGGELIIR